jgi:hypothetical protein
MEGISLQEIQTLSAAMEEIYGLLKSTRMVTRNGIGLLVKAQGTLFNKRVTVDILLQEINGHEKKALTIFVL